MQATHLPLPIWQTFLLAVPIALVVGTTLWWAFVPVVGLALRPFKRRIMPKLDLVQVRKSVAFGAAAGAAIGWILFLLSLHR